MSRIRSGQRRTRRQDTPADQEAREDDSAARQRFQDGLAAWRELLTANHARWLRYKWTAVSESPSDLYPLTPDADITAIRREQDWRDRELADLPDPEPTYIDPDEIPPNE